MTTLAQFNASSAPAAAALLEGVYERSPWIAELVVQQRPFASLTALEYALARAVNQASRQTQISLVRVHPELAGKAMVAQSLTAESSHEQRQAGLTHCTPQEFTQLQQLNTDYNTKFGWPFILAVRGPRGTGLSKLHIIDCFTRRLHGHPDFELQECLRQIHRIAQMRLNDKFGMQPTLGNTLWDWHEALAQHSEPSFKEQGQLTVTYLSDAHRACAAQLANQMRECGFDDVVLDAVGNVVGRYYKDSKLSNEYIRGQPKKPTILMTGSHYDTVRNGGKYDGRLGIYTPMLCVRELHRTGKRLPFEIELVAFAEEEGQRYPATFLGSSALLGQFNPAWLAQKDAEGISMRAAMEHAGHDPAAIAGIARQVDDYLGFVEIHVEQGPVLNALDLPLGVVTSINGSLRYQCEILGMASHAGTTPMNRRHDAAAAAAELSMYLEQRALQDGDSVATMGMLNVPGGSINVVPGRCLFSLDLRAPTDAQRDALAADVLAQLEGICNKRGLRCKPEEVLRAAAAPSHPVWQKRWERAVTALGLPVHRMPSGAGHDAMKLHEIMPQAMLFVRGENCGISHNPLESTTSDDMQLCIEAFNHLLDQLAQELA